MKYLKKLVAFALSSILLTGSFATASVSAATLDEAEVKSSYEYTIIDVSIIQRIGIGMIPMSNDYLKIYDFTNDGRLGVRDASILQKYLVGMISALPEIVTDYTDYTEQETSEPSSEETVTDSTFPTTESIEVLTEVSTEQMTEDNTESITEAVTKSTTNNHSTAYFTDCSNVDDSYKPYAISLSDEQRMEIERVVSGEFGNSYEGSLLIAQAIRDHIMSGNVTADNFRKKLLLDGYSENVTDNAKNAVQYIFDEGGMAVPHRIYLFYNSLGMTSDWHERQDFVYEYNKVRFFDSNDFIPNGDTTLEPVETEPTVAENATYVKLNKSNIKMGLNETYALKAESDFLDSIMWISTDESVLTVENGVLFPKSVGKTTVVAYTESGLKAECDVEIANEVSKVTLNATSLTLGVGEQFDLDSHVNSGSAALFRDYYSDNDSVAEVQEAGGLVTAKSAGVATIRCVLQNGLEATCTVTVKPMATSISLNKTSVNLGLGETFDFDSYVGTGTAAYYRHYYSEDTSVVSIAKSGGLAKGVKVGKTRIYCKLLNGTVVYANVIVSKAPETVTLSNSSYNVKVGDNRTVTATFGRNEFSNTSNWVSSAPYIVKITQTDNNKTTFKAMSQGTATLTYTTYNNKKATCKITVSGTNVKAIDVSTWQGNIDFNKVKSAGYDYVIIRAGYGRETYQKDNMFDINYAKAKSAGLKVGVYWFSYSTTVSDAYNEARACLYCLNGKQLDLPVYYDLEYEKAIYNMSQSSYTQMALNFCKTIESAGYRAGVYSSASVWGGYPLNRSTIVNNGYSVWNAQWASYTTVPCDIWQFSETQRVNGISTTVDGNWIYNLNIVQ